MISRLFGFFKRPKVMVLTGIFLLMLVIYFVAPLLKLTGDAQINATLLIGGLALLAAIIVWTKQWFDERQAKAQLKGGAREQAARGDATEAAEVRQLEKDFDRAMNELAQIKPGASVFKAGSSESLPWITIIGPPGAGKSTVLQASGLRFTSLGKRVRGVGGTRSCVFWLAEEAIFIDTAGRYSTQDEDHEEWLGFLRLLRRIRKERPLDAAILQVGLDEILNLEAKDIEEVANTLRSRLDELIANLQVKFPVYLVFNKMDKLEGFSEFFGGMLKNELSQPWGFAIDASELGSGAIGPLFEERFDELVDALVDRATHRVLNIPSREQRELALAFPMELARHKEALQLFTDLLFEHSRHRERPWLAAVHFVSALQEGRNIPGIRQTLLNEQGTPPPPGEAPGRAEKPYFVQGVFQRLVQEARDAARPSSNALRNMRITLYATAAALIPACAALAWLFSDSFLIDSTWLKEVVAAADGLVKYNDLPPQPEKIERDYLVKELLYQGGLESLLRLQESSGLIAGTHDKATSILRTRVDDKWITPLEPSLNRRLDEGSTWRPGEDEKLFADGFLALKADYVLSGGVCPGSDPEGTRSWVSQYLASVWQAEFKDRAADVLAGSAPMDLQDRLHFFFEGTQRSRIRLDDRARDDATRALKGQTSRSQGQIAPEVVFNLIVANTNLTSIEPQIAGELLNDPGLKKVFTLEGCEKFLSSSEQGKEWWKCLLDIDKPPAIDRDKTYLDKFTDARYKWLRDIAADPFKKPINDVGSASQALAWLENPQTSELDQLMEAMGGEAITSKAGLRRRGVSSLIPNSTGIFGRLAGCFRRAENYNRQLEQAGISTRPQVCQQAQQKFTPFAIALKEEDKTPIPASYGAYKDAMRRLKDRLARIHRSSDANRTTESLKLLQETMNSEGELYELRKTREEFITQVRGGLPQVDPEALDTLLAKLETRIWAVIIPLAAQALEEDWNTSIFQPWSAVEFKPIRDKENELGACNRIKKFGEEKLIPFVDERLRIFFDGKDLKKCSLSELQPDVKMPLRGEICWKLDSSLSTLLTLECQEGGGGEAATPGLPDTVEATGQECTYPIESVELDTAEKIYQCTISTGRCRELDRKSSGRARFVAKRKGQGNSGLEYFTAGSYGDLLSKGSRRGSRVEFPIRVENCKSMSAIIYLAGGSEGKPGKKTDTRFKAIALPAKITQGAGPK